MSISLPRAEWLEWHARKQGVAGSIPGRGIHYHFEIFANGTLFTSRRRPYKWNQAWHSSRVNGWTEKDLILKQKWRRFIWRQVSFKDPNNLKVSYSINGIYWMKSSFETLYARYGEFIKTFKADMSSYQYATAIFLILNLILCTHYSRWMSYLISFVWASPRCEQSEARKKIKMKIYASTGNRTSDPRFPAWHLYLFDYADSLNEYNIVFKSQYGPYANLEWQFEMISVLQTFTLLWNINQHVRQCMYDFGEICIGTDCHTKSAFLLPM